MALAVFATRPADILLLDEPTNHLDGAAVASLCAGLREHKGVVPRHSLFKCLWSLWRSFKRLNSYVLRVELHDITLLQTSLYSKMCFFLHLKAAEVLVASHDKAFLESLEVTDQILVKRDVVGQPGTLKVSWLTSCMHAATVFWCVFLFFLVSFWLILGLKWFGYGERAGFVSLCCKSTIETLRDSGHGMPTCSRKLLESTCEPKQLTRRGRIASTQSRSKRGPTSALLASGKRRCLEPRAVARTLLGSQAPVEEVVSASAHLEETPEPGGPLRFDSVSCRQTGPKKKQNKRDKAWARRGIFVQRPSKQLNRC